MREFYVGDSSIQIAGEVGGQDGVASLLVFGECPVDGPICLVLKKTDLLRLKAWLGVIVANMELAEIGSIRKE